MVLSWAEVTQKQEYAKLPVEQKQQAADEYFRSVVAPKLQGNGIALASAYEQFQAEAVKPSLKPPVGFIGQAINEGIETFTGGIADTQDSNNLGANLAGGFAGGGLRTLAGAGIGFLVGGVPGAVVGGAIAGGAGSFGKDLRDQEDQYGRNFSNFNYGRAALAGALDAVPVGGVGKSALAKLGTGALFDAGLNVAGEYATAKLENEKVNPNNLLLAAAVGAGGHLGMEGIQAIIGRIMAKRVDRQQAQAQQQAQIEADDLISRGMLLPTTLPEPSDVRATLQTTSPYGSYVNENTGVLLNQQPQDVQATTAQRVSPDGQPIGEPNVLSDSPDAVFQDMQQQQAQSAQAQQQAFMAQLQAKQQEVTDLFASGQTSQALLERNTLKKQIAGLQAKDPETARLIASTVDNIDTARKGLKTQQETTLKNQRSQELGVEIGKAREQAIEAVNFYKNKQTARGDLAHRSIKKLIKQVETETPELSPYVADLHDYITAQRNAVKAKMKQKASLEAEASKREAMKAEIDAKYQNEIGRLDKQVKTKNAYTRADIENNLRDLFSEDAGHGLHEAHASDILQELGYTLNRRALNDKKESRAGIEYDVRFGKGTKGYVFRGDTRMGTLIADLTKRKGVDFVKTLAKRISANDAGSTLENLRYLAGRDTTDAMQARQNGYMADQGAQQRADVMTNERDAEMNKAYGKAEAQLNKLISKMDGSLNQEELLRHYESAFGEDYGQAQQLIPDFEEKVVSALDENLQIVQDLEARNADADFEDPPDVPEVPKVEDAPPEQTKAERDAERLKKMQEGQGEESKPEAITEGGTAGSFSDTPSAIEFAQDAVRKVGFSGIEQAQAAYRALGNDLRKAPDADNPAKVKAYSMLKAILAKEHPDGRMKSKQEKQQSENLMQVLRTDIDQNGIGKQRSVEDMKAFDDQGYYTLEEVQGGMAYKKLSAEAKRKADLIGKYMKAKNAQGDVGVAMVIDIATEGGQTGKGGATNALRGTERHRVSPLAFKVQSGEMLSFLAHNGDGHESLYYLDLDPQMTPKEQASRVLKIHDQSTAAPFVGTYPNVYKGAVEYRIEDVMNRPYREEGVNSSELKSIYDTMQANKHLIDNDLLDAVTIAPTVANLKRMNHELMKLSTDQNVNARIKRLQDRVEKVGRVSQGDIVRLKKALEGAGDLKAVQKLCTLFGLTVKERK